MEKLIIISLAFVMSSCYNQETLVDKSKLTGYDYRLYQSTPAWTLAKAVKAEDVEKIKEEVLQKKVPVDFKDSKYGSTLLRMAIFNEQYVSVKILLELGANPNQHDSFTGATPVIAAAGSKDPKFLKLLLAYKGDPNSREHFSEPNSTKNTARETALTACISSLDGYHDLEKVKMLVEEGADIHYSKKGMIPSVFDQSLTLDKMDVALYLIEKGVDYTQPIFSTILQGKIHESSVLQMLRRSIIDLDTEQYKNKMKLVAFLKSKGLDYDKEPIEPSTIERIKAMHPDNWEEYLKRY
jgi:uncharacterized protein